MYILGWLTADNNNNNNMAYCKVCNATLRPHKTDLRRHAKRPVHLTNMQKINVSKQPKITTMGITHTITNEAKTRDIRLAIYTAVHTSLQSIDHLSETLININKPIFQDLKLHRTKCSCLIKNVIAPAMMEELIIDIGNSCYSLIIDESTDVSICKYMAICIRYYSSSKSRIVTNYLGLFEVTKASADILTESLINFLKTCNLSINKLVGLGTDGANNLSGRNHSVYVLLKQHVPSLQLIKCVAHSLHLCCSKAAEALPSSLDILCKETYNWFSCSPLRRSLYKETFNLLNTGTDVKFYNIVQLSGTRWLSRAKAMQVILNQWLELKTHFSFVVNKEKCYIGRTLYEMYNDNSLYLYLSFVCPILNNLNRVNLLFQTDEIDIFKIYAELYMLLLSNLRFIIKPIFLEGLNEVSDKNFQIIQNVLENSLAFIPSDLIDYGYKFREIVLENKITNSLEIKDRCKEFIKILCKQLCERMPENLNLINSFKCFTIENSLNKYNRPKFDELPLYLIENTDINKSDLEIEWNNLINININLPENYNSEQFWIYIHNYKNAGGNFAFKNISTLALIVLSLPLSNAVVERVFSGMNNVKSMSRNKLNMQMLNALLIIKFHLLFQNKCCKNVIITESMYRRFNSSIMYGTQLKLLMM